MDFGLDFNLVYAGVLVLLGGYCLLFAKNKAAGATAAIAGGVAGVWILLNFPVVVAAGAVIPIIWAISSKR